MGSPPWLIVYGPCKLMLASNWFLWIFMFSIPYFILRRKLPPAFQVLTYRSLLHMNYINQSWTLQERILVKKRWELVTGYFLIQISNIKLCLVAAYFRYSDGGTSFRNKETITIVDVKLSRTELRKKVTKPTWNKQQSIDLLYD